jgi:hypothetical protein
VFLSSCSLNKGEMAENLPSASSSSDDNASHRAASDEMSLGSDEMSVDLNAAKQDAMMIFSQHAVKKIQAKKGMSQQQVMALTTAEALEEVEIFFARIVDLPFCYDRHNKRFSRCTCLKILDYHEVKLIASFVCKSLSLYLTMLV